MTRGTGSALAAAAFAHTAAYDAAVASWFAGEDAATSEALPAFVGLAYEKVGDLRYGENPHQRGALYREAAAPGPLGGAQRAAGQGHVVQQLARRRRGIRARRRPARAARP